MIATALTLILGYLVAKAYHRREQIAGFLKTGACGLLDHPASSLEIAPGRLYVKCHGCGFESCGVSVPVRGDA